MVPLHCHSYYSLLDSVLSPKSLVQKSKEMGFDACALTDHGNVSGVIEFYKEAQKEGIKPILGCEVYVAEDDRRHKQGILKVGKNCINTIADRMHLVLLAKSARGFDNIVKIVNDSWENGFYIKPRIDFSISELSDDIIAFPCASGGIGKLLLAQEYELAKNHLYKLKNIFSNLFIEIQANLEDPTINLLLYKLAIETGIPAIVSSDVHFDDYNMFKSINRVKYRYKRNNDDDGVGMCRMMSESEIRQRLQYLDAKFIEECIANTHEIASLCNVTLDFGLKIPGFPVDNPKDKLRALAFEGASARGVKDFDRLNYELSVIFSKNLESYFLIVYDFIKYAREHNIYVGPGRGSGAGSLVSYCLGITSIDPVKHGLLFERFLNPERNELPDLDIDFEDRYREKIIEYVAKKYNNVSRICTFSYFKSRSAFKEACRLMNIPFSVANHFSKSIPYTDDFSEVESEMQKIDKEIRGIYELTKELMGIPRHVSQHAAGIVIAPNDVEIPIMVIQGNKVCQWDMNSVSNYGLLKFDFLGLRTLSVIHDVEKENAVCYDFNDKSTWDLYCNDTKGIFQAEGSGMSSLMKRIRPRNIDELCAAIALFRPGPLQAGLVDTYVKNKREKVAKSAFPNIDDILSETFGTIVYQEQIMQIAQRIANYSASEADILRKAIGKKNAKLMASEKAKFLARCTLPEKEALKMWDAIEKFASYSFNKSHSMAYAYLSFMTAYLKKHYPLQFWCALLNSVADDFDKLSEYCNYIKDLIESPQVRNASLDFKVSGRKIVYGLRGVKNVGVSGAKAILRVLNRPLDQIIDMNSINKRIIESLLVAGFWGNNGITVYSQKTGIQLGIDRSTLAIRNYDTVKKVIQCTSRTGKTFWKIILVGGKTLYSNNLFGIRDGSVISYKSNKNDAGFEWIREVELK